MIDKRINGVIYLKDIETGKEYEIPGKYLRPCQPFFDLTNKVEKDPTLQKKQYQVEICRHYPQNECRFEHKCNKMHICGTFFQQIGDNYNDHDNYGDNNKKLSVFNKERKKEEKTISIINHFCVGEKRMSKLNNHNRYNDDVRQKNNQQINKRFNVDRRPISFVSNQRRKNKNRFGFFSKYDNENESEDENSTKNINVFHAETGRIMQVPINAIQYTKGIKNGRDHKNCMYYLNGECKFGSQCLDIHVHRDFMKFYLDRNNSMMVNKKNHIINKVFPFQKKRRFNPYKDRLLLKICIFNNFKS